MFGLWLECASPPFRGREAESHCLLGHLASRCETTCFRWRCRHLLQACYQCRPIYGPLQSNWSHLRRTSTVRRPRKGSSQRRGAPPSVELDGSDLVSLVRFAQVRYSEPSFNFSPTFSNSFTVNGSRSKGMEILIAAIENIGRKIGNSPPVAARLGRILIRNFGSGGSN